MASTAEPRVRTRLVGILASSEAANTLGMGRVVTEKPGNLRSGGSTKVRNMDGIVGSSSAGSDEEEEDGGVVS